MRPPEAEQTVRSSSPRPPDASSSTLRIMNDPLSAFQTMSTSSKDDSFDSIDMPLKTVKECMKRLEMQQKQNELDEEEMQGSVQGSVQESLRKNLRLDQLKPVYDEPVVRKGRESVNYDQIRKDMMTVSLDWDPWRSSSSCPCGTRFEITSTRSHCHSCGKIFCLRCTDRLILLPGHRISSNPQLPLSNTTSTNLCNKSSNTESSEGDVFESSQSETKNVLGKGSKVNVCKSCHKIVLEME